MLLTKWAPERVRVLDRINKAMDDLISDEFRGSWSPCVDVKETDTELIFMAEMPGMELKDVDVELNGDVLTIRGTREFNHEERKEDFVRIERSYGTFHRSFTLDTHVKPEAISAVCKNGVLTVRVPKAESRPPHKIEVRQD